MNIKVSALPPYLQRLVAEFTELDERIGKLKDFMASPRFPRVRLEERQLLTRQLGVMTEYLEILSRRIAIGEELS